MDKYVRLEAAKPSLSSEHNEVRIMTDGKMRNYIKYATTLLMDKGEDFIVLKGMGRAINKTVTVAEIVKRRVVGLHQDVEISSLEITDTWEPREEGLETVVTTRHVSVVSIMLCRDVGRMDASSPGYQEPIPEDQVRPLQTTFDAKKKPKKIIIHPGGGEGDGDGDGDGDKGEGMEGVEGERKKRRKRRGRGGRGKSRAEGGGGGGAEGRDDDAMDTGGEGGDGGGGDGRAGGTRRGSRGGGKKSVAPVAD